jgi:hypothetical protein
VNVKRKDVERRESNQPNVQLRRHTGVLRKSKKLRQNVLDGADFVRDVRNTCPNAPSGQGTDERL